MDKPLFSIVVPIFKVEEYLEECVNSLKNQIFSNYEIILVDDGSPDRCPQICDEFSKNDSKIKVIHKKNGGLSSARNCGMEHAKGEYIIFVDSDDYWNSIYALENIAKQIERLGKVDVLIFKNVDYSCLTGKIICQNKEYNISLLENSPKESVLQYLFENGLFPGAAWITVTRKDFLKENQINFIEGIKAEDIDWLLKVFLGAEKISAVNDAFYVYRKYRNGSITGTADKKSIEDLLYTLKLWEQKLNEEYKKFKSLILSFLCNHYICAVLIYDNLPKHQKPESKKMLYKHKYIMKYSSSTLVNIARYLPIGMLSKLLNIYRGQRKF